MTIRYKIITVCASCVIMQINTRKMIIASSTTFSRPATTLKSKTIGINSILSN